MNAKLALYWNDFLDIVFPRCCEACETALLGNEKLICTACRISLPRAEAGFQKDVLQGKFAGNSEVQEVFAFLVFTKKGRVQHLLQALKYKGVPEVGVLLGTMMAQELQDRNGFPEADLILSVPLHPKRKAERGYNQSDAFAEGLSEVSRIPWSGTVLQRTIYTKTQTGKSKTERRETMQGVFAVNSPELIAGKKIILIDDVLTTGATLQGCIDVLIESGCSTLYIMTLAAAQ